MIGPFVRELSFGDSQEKLEFGGQENPSLFFILQENGAGQREYDRLFVVSGIPLFPPRNTEKTTAMFAVMVRMM